MGAALFIVLEQEIPGFDSFVGGKAISHASKGLDRIAQKLGVTPLMDFHSMDPGEASGFLEDLGVSDEVAIPPEAWFAPDEGLRTVEALRTHLRRRTEVLPRLDDVLADLDAFARVLGKAKEAGVRWHLQVDF